MVLKSLMTDSGHPLADGSLERRLLHRLLQEDPRNTRRFAKELTPEHFTDPAIRAEIGSLLDRAGPSAGLPSLPADSSASDDETNPGGQSREPIDGMVRRLEDLRNRRELFDWLGETRRKVTNLNGDLQALLSSHFAACGKLCRNHSLQDDPVAERVISPVEEMERSYESQGEPEGWSTGLESVDLLLDGLLPGRLLVVGGEEGTGKTALALTIAGALLRQDVRVGISTGRLDEAELVRLLYFQLSRVDELEIRQGRLTETDFERLQAAGSDLCGQRLSIRTLGERTLRHPGDLLDGWAREGVQVVLLEDIHLFSNPGAEVTLPGICQALSWSARTHSMSIVAFTGLRCAATDLTEGTAEGYTVRELLKLKVDTVALMRRPEGEMTASPFADPSPTVHFDAVRNVGGPTDSVPLRFDPRFYCLMDPDRAA